MKRLKKVLCAFAALALAFAFTGCGEYKPPADSGDTPPITETPANPDPTPDQNPDDPVDPADDSFKVALTCDGVPFTRANYSGITSLRAQWTNKETKQVHRANFDSEGVARIKDLDGDYKVTLAGLPDGYTYEPNVYSADNDYREVSIRLFKLTRLGNPYIYGGNIGTDRNVPVYPINTIGAYRVTLNSEDEKVFFRFLPGENGVYTITSMVDVTANEINPLMDIFLGNSQYISPSPSVEQDGGAGADSENTYTKNFNAEYTVSPDEAAGAVMIFRLHSTCRNANAYPLVVDFILDRDGDFKREYPVAEIVPVEEDFTATPEQPAGTFVFCADRALVKTGKESKLLDEKSVALNPDGYYYYCTKNSNGEVTEWYERLYVKITAETQVSDAFTHPLVRLYNLNGYNYTSFIATYRTHVNADGCYPVNEELKKFVQNYAKANQIFYDGDGVAEKFNGYSSDEFSQWMYACGYYEA